MKRVLRVLVTIVFILGALAAAGISATVGWRPFIGPEARPLTDRRFEPTPARLERGEYLVRNVTVCLACHSELDTSAEGLPVKAGMAGAGKPMTPEEMPWLVAPNITPDSDTGAGSWTDDAIARAVREGIGHDGRALFPVMPYENYRIMSDEDLASVIAYVRSLPAVRHAPGRTEVPFPVSRLINSAPKPLHAPVAAPDLSTPEKRGAYLATLASCTDCHTPRNDKGQYLTELAFSGGNMVGYAPAVKAKASSNITQAVNGIPYYTDELFVETLRTGRVRERKLSDMMPWGHYRGMTDEDLRAIFAYLKSVKPIDHYIDNEQPATPCAVCGLQHGGGARNKKAE
jgi:mono/diheme cytochrome c family protein